VFAVPAEKNLQLFPNPLPRFQYNARWAVGRGRQRGDREEEGKREREG